MIIALSLLVALIGCLMFAFAASGKVQELGKIMFAAGILAFLLQAPVALKAIGILHQ